MSRRSALRKKYATRGLTNRNRRDRFDPSRHVKLQAPRLTTWRWMGLNRNSDAPRLRRSESCYYGAKNPQFTGSCVPAPPTGKIHLLSGMFKRLATSVDVTRTAAARLMLLNAFISKGSVAIRNRYFYVGIRYMVSISSYF